MRSKKSQGISLSTVVIAAIALVVLIILILIFSGRIAIFNRGVIECPAGSEAVPTGQTCQNAGDYELIPARITEDSEGKIVYCCIPKENDDNTDE